MTSTLLGSYSGGIPFNVHKTPNTAAEKAPGYNHPMKFKNQTTSLVTATLPRKRKTDEG